MRNPERHADEVLAAVTSSRADLKSAVETSWRRSATLHGLDPVAPARADRLTDSEYKAARERMQPVITHAATALDRLFSLVGRNGCGVVLTDPEGVIVEHRVAPGDEVAFRASNLWRKAVWSEAIEGTNGIGTCLAEERALSIRGDQHFANRNIGLTCIDAPVWGPDGRIVAALDVSTCREDETEGTTHLIEAVVRDTAAWIETELFRATYAGTQIIMGPNVAQGQVSLLALDRDDLLIGASRSARKALALKETDFGRPLTSSSSSASLDAAERSEIVRVLASTNGNASAAARELGVSRATLYRKMARLGIERDADLSQN